MSTAQIAQVTPGMVRTDGAILEIGTISASTVAASVGQAVKKSGRTTGLTRSKVSGLNATVSVAYENECAGGAAFTKTFTGQIVIANSGSKFLNSGDSGSLMVEDVAKNPRAVGLSVRWQQHDSDRKSHRSGADLLGGHDGRQLAGTLKPGYGLQ